MQFRAVINDQNCMREFFTIISTQSRISKEICFNIQSDQILIINCDNKINGLPQIWSDINKESYFQQYVVKGICKQKNNPFILFTISTIKLTTAISLLRASIGISYVKLKLTDNNNCPCLTIDIEIAQTESDDLLVIGHDVPIQVIQKRDWPEFELPKIRKFPFTLKMPCIRLLRMLMDKMKNISPTMTICLQAKGEFSVVIETISATIASHFTNLETQKNDGNPAASDDDDSNNDKDKDDEISCRIDTKQFSNCISSIQLQEAQMYCNVKQGRVMKMFVKVRDGVHLNFLMWSVASS